MSNASSKKPAVAAESSKGVSETTPHGVAGITWGPAAAVLVTVMAMAGAYLAAGLVAYMLPRLMQWSSGRADEWFSTVLGQFVFIVLAESVIVAIVVWFLHHRKTTVRVLGFYRRPNWWDAGYVVICFGLYLIAVAALTTLAKVVFHIDLDQKQELGFDTVISNSDKILTFASLVVIPPLVEEFLFRGFLFGGLRKKLPFVSATLITSALFASLHLAEGSGGVLWVAGIDTFVLSLFLCYVREKTGNLWAGILLHACKNAVAFLYLYVFMSR